jgi:hypothetical protein
MYAGNLTNILNSSSSKEIGRLKIPGLLSELKIKSQ